MWRLGSTRGKSCAAADGSDDPVQLRARQTLRSADVKMMEATKWTTSGGGPTDTLDSVSCNLDEQFEVRNWRYHLTNERF